MNALGTEGRKSVLGLFILGGTNLMLCVPHPTEDRPQALSQHARYDQALWILHTTQSYGSVIVACHDSPHAPHGSLRDLAEGSCHPCPSPPLPNTTPTNPRFFSTRKELVSYCKLYTSSYWRERDRNVYQTIKQKRKLNFQGPIQEICLTHFQLIASSDFATSTWSLFNVCLP